MQKLRVHKVSREKQKYTVLGILGVNNQWCEFRDARLGSGAAAPLLWSDACCGRQLGTPCCTLRVVFIRCISAYNFPANLEFEFFTMVYKNSICKIAFDDILVSENVQVTSN